MDAGFIDLDILLTRIRHAQSKVYFLDAVKAYKAGALRASLTSAWVAPQVSPHIHAMPNVSEKVGFWRRRS